MSSLLAACLFLAPQASAAEPGAAMTLYRRVMERYETAAALGLEASFTSETWVEDQPAVSSAGVLRLEMMRPLQGSLRVDYSAGGEEGSVEFLATGRDYFWVDHAAGTWLNLAEDPSPLRFFLDLDPLQRWAGFAVREPERVTLLEPPPRLRGLTGLAVEGGGRRQEWWLDSQDHLIAAAVIPDPEQRDAAHPRLDFVFFRTELRAEAAPRDYQVELPADYAAADSGAGEAAGEDYPLVGSPAPQAELLTLEGKPFPLASLRGRTVLLNFWFYDCRPCREELPALQRLWEETARGRDDVVFLCVDLGDPPERIAAFWQESGFGMLVARQAGTAVSEAFGVVAYPSNFVLSPQGEVLYGRTGWDAKALRAALAAARDQ